MNIQQNKIKQHSFDKRRSLFLFIAGVASSIGLTQSQCHDFILVNILTSASVATAIIYSEHNQKYNKNKNYRPQIQPKDHFLTNSKHQGKQVTKIQNRQHIRRQLLHSVQYYRKQAERSLQSSASKQLSESPFRTINGKLSSSLDGAEASWNEGQTDIKHVIESNVSPLVATTKKTLTKSFERTNDEDTSMMLVPRNIATTLDVYLYEAFRYPPSSVIALYWDSAGLLNISSKVEGHDHWFDKNVKDDFFSQTTSSTNGKVALLYNSDVTKWVHSWEIEPPVPFLFYTIPLSVVEVKSISSNSTFSSGGFSGSNFKLIPNPYDRSGLNENWIARIQNYLGTNRTHPSVSYDEYMSREKIIVWRGSIHRNDLIRTKAVEMSNHQSLNSSNELQQQWLDIAEVHGHDTDSEQSDELDIVTMSLNYKYQLDLGGVSGTSWGGLRWKMCASSGLVFKVESGYVDWWHASIQPWKHYVPVQNDLSDLRQMFDWAEANPDDAYRIITAGQLACLETSSQQYAFDTYKDVIQSIPETTADLVQEALAYIEESLLG